MLDPKPPQTKLIAAVSLAAVTAASFVLVFPFSGHVFGVAVVLVSVVLQRGRDLREWFGKTGLWKIAVGAIACVLALLASDLVLMTLLPRLGFQPVDFSRFADLRGNAPITLTWLAAIIGFVAPVEEIISRGFLINRWLELFAGSRFSQALATLASAATFGLLHLAHEGPTGVVMNFGAGLLFAALYLQQRRTLWACIAAHALSDSIAIIAFYFGVLS
jgi:membrane protease YdiL (CAAX protease family)